MTAASATHHPALSEPAGGLASEVRVFNVFGVFGVVGVLGVRGVRGRSGVAPELQVRFVLSCFTTKT